MTTSTAPFSTVIGVFPDHERAEKAIDELRHMNFPYERIRMVERGTGSFGDTLKSLFTGQASSTSNAADNLVKMGMPEYEARYYQRELDVDRVLLIMNADERPEEAFSVMRQNGACDINSRLRVNAANGFPRMRDAERGQVASTPNMPPMASSASSPHESASDTSGERTDHGA